jgi:modulator of FtsH protease HflK
MDREEHIHTSEMQRMIRPLLHTMNWAFQRLHWFLALLVLGYLLSGITIVKSDEVAILLRFGRLVGGSGPAVNQPGLLFVLPKPMDEVVRVKVKKIYEIEIYDLHYRNPDETTLRRPHGRTMDPENKGYCLTGDHNIVQIEMVARYQITDPVAYVLWQSDPEVLLHNTIVATTVRAIGEVDVDGVLSEGRGEFVLTLLQRSQARLDAVESGISLVSVEIIDLTPPRQALDDFKKVQNAFIDMETQIKGARKLQREQIPLAEAAKDISIREAESYAVGVLASARGDVDLWKQVYAEYRKNPEVVRERIYRETIETQLAEADYLRLVPPPVQGGRYEDLRITISVRR